MSSISSPLIPKRLSNTTISSGDPANLRTVSSAGRVIIISKLVTIVSWYWILISSYCPFKMPYQVPLTTWYRIVGRIYFTEFSLLYQITSTGTCIIFINGLRKIKYFNFYSYSYYLTWREYESFNEVLLFRNMKGGRSENLFMSCVGELGKFFWKHTFYVFKREKILTLFDFFTDFPFFLVFSRSVGEPWVWSAVGPTHAGWEPSPWPHRQVWRWATWKS